MSEPTREEVEQLISLCTDWTTRIDADNIRSRAAAMLRALLARAERAEAALETQRHDYHAANIAMEAERDVARAEVARLRAEVASLRLTLGGKTFDTSVPEPIGCPVPGACATVAEIVRLREALQAIARSGDYGTLTSPDGDRHADAILTARAALAGEDKTDADPHTIKTPAEVAALLAQARAEEREAIAQMFDDDRVMVAGTQVAAAIRARAEAADA